MLGAWVWQLSVELTPDATDSWSFAQLARQLTRIRRPVRGWLGS